MELGIIGLGRMGGNMALRLLAKGHRVFVNNRSPGPMKEIASRGAVAANTPPELVAALSPPRAVWLMVPAGRPTDDMMNAVLPAMSKGDTLIDGGNSYYKHTLVRAAEARKHGVDFVDVGTSGGVWGRENGYCLMIGGAESVVARLQPLFEALAPAPDKGWSRVGPIGAGHFVKMVHNGIEYGLMQAYAEGFAIMERKAEFGLDLAKIAEIWGTGSVVRSWLLELTAAALRSNGDLAQIVPHVDDSGEGRWTVAEAIDLDVAAPVITLALQARLRSRDQRVFGDRLLAVLREQFGAHPVQREV
jgi:6-phosphogluconate dehydrogenase